MSQLLKTKQLAQYLNLKPVTIRRKARRGEIPSVKLGKRFRFDKRAINKWLIKNTGLKSAHVLVIDDEPTVGQLIKEYTKEYGFQITIALNSLEALEKFIPDRYVLVFLNLIMPDLNGDEIFRRIRESDKHVPVVIITSYPHSDTMKRAMECGPFTVLSKPFTNDNILNIVRNIK